MPHHKETRILPYTPTQVFDLVADIERYPEFLPWCKGTQIIEKDEASLVADLVVGNHLINERFRSQVRLERPSLITVAYGGGALRHLSTEWRFEDAPTSACEVSFFVDFELRSRLLAGAMNLFFDAAFNRMVEAFEARAIDLYGK